MAKQNILYEYEFLAVLLSSDVYMFLQVHIVEGAGLVKEGSKKPYNSFVKW